MGHGDLSLFLCLAVIGPRCFRFLSLFSFSHANFMERYIVRVFSGLQQTEVRIASDDVASSVAAERRHAIASDFSPMKKRIGFDGSRGAAA